MGQSDAYASIVTQVLEMRIEVFVMWRGGVRSVSGGGKLVGGVALVALASCLAGCGGRRDTPTPAPQIGARSLTIHTGSTRRLSATGDVQVHWGISERDVGASEEPVYPLTVSANGRYLVDQRGRPWRVKADAGWLMSARATPRQVDQYLARRKAQGFNSFYLHVMVHPGGYPTAPDAPNDWRGDPPLATPGDYSTAAASRASRRYWAWIDSIIDKAAAHHMVVMLAYGYLGWRGGDTGWYEDIVAQPSRRALFDWGAWIGNRYKDKANLMWFGLGDLAPPIGSEGAARARAMADGIKSVGARQLFMAEASPPDSVPGEVPYFGSILDQNSFYGYGPDGRGAVYETADRAWIMSPTRPAWMQEGTYEYEDNVGHFSAQPWDTRRGRFWSVLAGGTAGDGFGSKDVWQWQNIPRSLSSPGAEYSTYAFELFDSLPWWELEPSGADAKHTGLELIPTGNGRLGGPGLHHVGTHVRSPLAAGVRSRDGVGGPHLLGRHVRARRPDTRALVRPDYGQLHRHQQRVRLRNRSNPQIPPRPGSAGTGPTTGPRPRLDGASEMRRDHHLGTLHGARSRAEGREVRDHGSVFRRSVPSSRARP